MSMGGSRVPSAINPRISGGVGRLIHRVAGIQVPPTRAERRLPVKRLLLAGVAAVGLGVAGTAAGHPFTASPSLTISKVPAGATSPGERIVVFGKIRTGRAFCKNDRRVRLFRVRPGADRLIATDRSDAEGEYGFALRPRRDQRVYTRIGRLERHTYAHDHVCRAARSHNLRINVR
jgi:hypothetical protein